MFKAWKAYTFYALKFAQFVFKNCTFRFADYSSKKLVDINKFYNTDRLRPQYNSFEFMPQMIL